MPRANAILDRERRQQADRRLQRPAELSRDADLITVSVVVLTFNEEANLGVCLRSVADWAAEVFVVDSGSTDSTREIAEQSGARIYEHTFQTHATQWAWALEQLPLRGDWVLALDADQEVTPELAQEIQALKAADLVNVDGIFLKRRQVFRQKWIKYGGYYPKYLLKMFRRGSVRIDKADLVDHHFYVTGDVRRLQHDLIEANKKEDDITFWVDKHNRYARLFALEQLERSGQAGYAITPSFFGNPDQKTLSLKLLWAKLPLYVRPFLYFTYRYVLRLGFLDGKEGAIFHFLQAFWFRLLVDINIDQLRRERARI
jgi:glycosyltransferase involved in cell wall biosynthesis